MPWSSYPGDVSFHMPVTFCTAALFNTLPLLDGVWEGRSQKWVPAAWGAALVLITKVADLPGFVGRSWDAMCPGHKCCDLAMQTLPPALVICIMSGSDPKCPDKYLSTQSLFSLLAFLCWLLLELGNTREAQVLFCVCLMFAQPSCVSFCLPTHSCALCRNMCIIVKYLSFPLT